MLHMRCNVECTILALCPSLYFWLAKNSCNGSSWVSVQIFRILQDTERRGSGTGSLSMLMMEAEGNFMFCFITSKCSILKSVKCDLYSGLLKAVHMQDSMMASSIDTQALRTGSGVACCTCGAMLNAPNLLSVDPPYFWLAKNSCNGSS